MTWYRVAFSLSVVSFDEIMALEDRLHDDGIHFDTGAAIDKNKPIRRDWELDESAEGATPDEILEKAKTYSPRVMEKAVVRRVKRISP